MKTLSLSVLTLSLLLSAPLAWAGGTYDSVEALLLDAKAGKASGKVLLREVLVVSKPELDDDDDNYVEEFHVQDFERVGGEVRAVGEGLRVRVETSYYGQDPFSEESDDPYEAEVPVTIKKGDVISLSANLDQNWTDDTYELSRTFKGDFYDDDMFEIYVEGGIDVEDFQHAADVLGKNWGLDDLEDFQTDSWSNGDPAGELAEFNEFLVKTFGLEPITQTDHVDERADAIWELDRGIRQVFTVHAEGVKPVVLTPAIAYMRPYTRIRQGTIAAIKVTNAGAVPQLRLDGTLLPVKERLPGLMLIQIPLETTLGEHQLTLGNGSDTSEPFRFWVKRQASPDNPAPVLDSATVVSSGRAAVLVLEGNHFKQEGQVRVYVGRRRVGAVLSRQHRTLIVQLPDEISGKTARVRVGDLRSNAVPVHGLRFLRPKTGAPAGALGGEPQTGFKQVLGQED